MDHMDIRLSASIYYVKIMSARQQAKDIKMSTVLRSFIHCEKGLIFISLIQGNSLKSKKQFCRQMRHAIRANAKIPRKHSCERS